MGSNTIIAIVVGAVLVIVGFSLWPVLNGASNSLYSFFRASCDDGSGNRFLRVYAGTESQTPASYEYSTTTGQHGGSGVRLQRSGGDCEGSGNVLTFVVTNEAGAGYTQAEIDADARVYTFYNEEGEGIPASRTEFKADSPYPASSIGIGAPGGTLDIDVSYQSDGEVRWVEVAPMLSRFSGINNLLLSILPVVSIAGFLGISGAKLYSYGKGTASIGSSISTSVFTLIGIVVAMVIAGPVLGSAVDANQVVVSGQYQVNTTFGNIIQLLFGMVPVVYIAGLVTLVSLQAKNALVGGGGGSLT